MHSVGGGVVDVCSFGLRLAALMLRTPAPRKLLLLDEPFKFVSEEYRPYIVDMIKAVADQMGVQIVLITHIPELMVLAHAR
jgi:DNA repair exonuclease SbcCD ATPase subunit